MQIKSIISFLAISCILVANSFAQSTTQPKILNYVAMEMAYKTALPLADEQIQALVFYFGYKFKNKLSLGLCTGNTTKLNFDTDTFSWYVPMGLGIRYRMFENENGKKNVGIEPYANFTNGVSFTSEETGNDYLSYDVGVNFVAKEIPFLLIGIGVGQHFYTNEEKDLLNIYFSFGLRF